MRLYGEDSCPPIPSLFKGIYGEIFTGLETGQGDILFAGWFPSGCCRVNIDRVDCGGEDRARMLSVGHKSKDRRHS